MSHRRRCVVAGELGLFAETLHAAALREGRLQQQQGSPRPQEGSAQQQQTVRFESHLYVTGNADDGAHSFRTRADRSLSPLTFPLTIPRFVWLPAGELSSLPDAVAAWLRASVKEGRPDLPGVCHNLTREKGDGDRGKTSAFFVCGPVRLPSKTFRGQSLRAWFDRMVMDGFRRRWRGSHRSKLTRAMRASTPRSFTSDVQRG